MRDDHMPAQLSHAHATVMTVQMHYSHSSHQISISRAENPPCNLRFAYSTALTLTRPHTNPKSDAHHILPSVEQEPPEYEFHGAPLPQTRAASRSDCWRGEKKRGCRSTSPNVVGDYGSENAVAGQSDGSKVSVSPREKMASTGSRARGLESDSMNAEDWTAQGYSRLPVRSEGCMYICIERRRAMRTAQTTSSLFTLDFLTTIHFPHKLL